jgi:periplasmic protein TonB
VPPSAPAVQPTASAMPIPTPPAPAIVVNSPALASEPAVVARVTEAPPPKPSKAPPVESVQPKPAASQKAATVVPDISASLSSHPKSSQRARSAESDAEPSLDMKSSSAENNVLSGIAAPSVAAPPPPQPAAAAAPVRIGGDIKPPRLISSVLPVYPAIARTAGIEGRVVITTSVEKDGSVSGSKVISGSPMLRQAALDALRQWKYQPGTLNGVPVPVEITVTIEFHR